MKAKLAVWLSFCVAGSAFAQAPAPAAAPPAVASPVMTTAAPPTATATATATAAATTLTTAATTTELNALLQLGATQYQQGNYAGAVDTLSAAVKLATEQFGENSPRTISPLRGLGMSLLAQQRPAEAAPLLARAVALSRRSHGLFNEEQAVMAMSLVTAYQQLGMYPEAEREQQYAYRGAEVRFGADDLRLLPALDRLARWYEETSRPAQARLLHRRAFTLATEPKKTTATGAVRALIGVARTYFLEYRDGPEVQETMDAGTANFHFGTETRGLPQPGNVYYLDPQAERALQLAMEIADRSQQATLQEEAVTAYGDYLLLDGKAAAAEKQFSRAALLRTARIAAGIVSPLEPDPLATPKALLVRKPLFVRRNEMAAPEDVDLHTTVVNLTVTPQGTVVQPKVVSSDLSTTHQRQWTSALERAVYRPRYIDGKATTAEGVEVVLVTRTLKADRSAPKPEAAADGKPATTDDKPATAEPAPAEEGTAVETTPAPAESKPPALSPPQS